MAENEHRKSKPFILRWIRRLFLLGALLLALPLVLVPVYAVVPPVSTLMVYDFLTVKYPKRRWVAFEDIPPSVRNSVLVSEDSRHCLHGGIDWVEFERVWRDYWAGGRARGASTITMQTVKNLFLWHGRSPLRKALEIPLALYADLIWSKRRTLEIYLNIVELDSHIYGVEAAARHYFNRPVGKLTPRQAALLAVTLPNPKARNPAKPGPGLRGLGRKIEKRAKAAGPYIACLKEKN